MELTAQTASAWLVAVAGPELEPIELPGDLEEIIIGRHEQCAVRLPLTADRVSRFHARFSFNNDRWGVADLNSRWGTFLNGVKIQPGQEMVLHEGDLIHIAPWTFSFRLSEPVNRGVETHNDVSLNQTLVKAFSAQDRPELAEDVTSLLLESAAGIHAAQNEQSLAEVVMDVACRGTGLSNAALLRPVDGQGRVEIIASKFALASAPSFSRSLINVALRGDVAELTGDSDNISASMVEMQIDSAICVPLMLGSSVAALLYLDARGRGAINSLVPGASAFCLALGRMASLALANLKRIDVEKRQAQMVAELSAGAEAQRWIFPRRTGNFGPFHYIGESRPGRYVGGDFFDVIPLDNDRVAVALGDVAGKGISASVLMTATQGFLHAALETHGDVSRAVESLNRFVNPRRPDTRFVTLWVAVLDGRARTLSYVDAGHGFGLFLAPDGSVKRLDAGGGLPIGIMDEPQFETITVPLAAGHRVLIVSDGIVEQFGGGDEGSKHQFELAGIEACTKSLRPESDCVESLFATLTRFAGTTHLSDDATAVLVKWD